MEGFIGEIKGFAGTFAPRDWAICDGQMMNIMDHQALYSILSNFYGGDGRVTFALPDLRGRVPMGEGRGPGLTDRRLGEQNGLEAVPLQVAQLPAHNHIAQTQGGTGSISGTITAKMKVNSSEGEERNPNGQYIGVSSASDIYQGDVTPGNTLADDAISVDSSGLSVNVSGIQVAIGDTGQNQPHYNIQPYTVINWIICLNGIYPSRT